MTFDPSPPVKAEETDADDDGSTPVRIAALHVYPVKACAGVSLPHTTLVDTGFEVDRQWMVVDGAGQFITQRDAPRLALVQVGIGLHALSLAAPSMAPLHLAFDAVRGTRPVQVWQDRVDALACSDAADAWFSAYLARPVHLVRFDPAVRRLSSARWTGALEAPNAFSDGYPLLVIAQASLDALNARLRQRGHGPVSMARFRPNLVLDGLDPHGEDGVDAVHFATPEGAVTLRLVKPCPRCPVPNIDPLTAERGTEPGDTLASYRADPRLDGAITFGMNAVIVEGVGRRLQLGQQGTGSVRF